MDHKFSRLNNWLREKFTIMYTREDCEFVFSLFKIVGLGLFLLATYTVIDYLISLQECPNCGHCGYLIEKYPVLGYTFKTFAFLCLPLAIYFGAAWRKARRLHHDEDLAKISELTDQLFERDQEIQRERDRFKQVVEMQMEYVSKHTPDGVLTFVNKALVDLLGLRSYRDLVGKNFYRYLDEEQTINTRKILCTITEEAPRVNHVEKLRAPKRGTVYIEWSNCGIFRDGKLHKILGVGRDITDRMAVEKKLRYTEGQFRGLFTYMVAGVAIHQIVCALDGSVCDYIFLEINPAFSRLFGFPREAVINKRVLEIMPRTEPSIIERFGNVANTGVADSFECQFADINKWFQVTAFRNEPGQFTATFLDISDRKNRTGKRERATDEPGIRQGGN